jgi:hypothetical protein
MRWRVMAKGKSRPKSEDAGQPAKDPLVPALDAFSRGDYPAARRLFAERVAAEEASESERTLARRLTAATWLERGALMVALACLGLYALVIAVAALKQP